MRAFRVAIAIYIHDQCHPWLAHDVYGRTHKSTRGARLIGWAALLVAHANEDTIQLRNGLRMPANGLGTCCRKTARGQPIIDATKEYLRLGGRLIDTAMAYRNHEEIGEALRASGVKREDVWITSKLASGTVNSYAKGLAAVDNILQEIGTSYLDLVLIHSPKMGKEKAEGAHRRQEGAGKAQ